MRSTTRRLTAAAAVLLATTALAACGSDNGASTDPTTATAEETSKATEETEAAEEPSAEETTSAPAALETNYDATAVDFGEPGAVTPPGTPLAFGEPAWVNVTYQDADQVEQTGGVGVAVLEVRPLDPSLFDGYTNAEEFAGYTPYAIITQHTWLFDMPDEYTNHPTVALLPMKEDGSGAEYLTGQWGFGASSNCGLQFPEFDPETRTQVSCIVGLSQDLPVTTAQYNGESYSAIFATEGNQYVAAPLIWG